MKKYTTLCLLIFIFSVSAFAQQTKMKWEVKNPFEHNVFIENKGQFSSDIEQYVKEPVLYYSVKGSVHLFFSRNSLTLITNKFERKDEDRKDDDRDKNMVATPELMKISWEGANPNAEVTTDKEASDYFTCPKPGITAHAWSRLIYHNLYNGIDVVFYYPAKGGLEYDIVIHPGADPSIVKMNYTGAKVLLEAGNIMVSSDCADITDHSPTAKDESGNDIASLFSVNNNQVSFKVGKYDRSKTLTIDPWFTATEFTGTNSAYDIGYDISGNVYIYGGGTATEYNLQKYNSSGVLQWTFIPSTFPEGGGSNYFYGDLVTDTRNGDCYINAGTGNSSSPNAQIDKVGPSGNLIRNFAGDSKIGEMWRMDIDYCHNMLVVGAGSNAKPPYQAYIIDTAFASGTAVNVLGTDSIFHDMALLALDQQGHAYMATSQTGGGNPTNEAISNNVLLQLPIPSLSPTAYQVSDGYTFQEINSVTYYGSIISGSAGNGMNGLVANGHMVVSYDGATVKKWTTTGTLKKSLVLPGGASFAQGGLDLDCQGHIYAGNGSAIDVYDSTLTTLLGTIPVANKVYDLKVASNGLVYACGKTFVGSYANSNISKMVTLGSTPPTTCSSCDGQVTANVSCGSGNYTYKWSNGATTSTITGLCQGTYSVVVTDASTCAGAGREDTASVKFFLPGGPGITISPKTNALCYSGGGGSATANASGGVGPYTYSWSPSGQTNATATNLSKGTYVVTVTNGSGCYNIDSVIISQPSQIKASTNISPACSGNNGNATVVASGGTMPYTYSWFPSGETNATAIGLGVGTYTVTVKDSNGCTQIQTATITTATGSGPALNPSQTTSSCAICNGTASESASGGTTPYVYAWSNGATSSSINNLCSGTYTVSVSSAGDTAIVPFYTENFSSGGTGWTLNIAGSGTNGTDANKWVIDNSTPLCNTGSYLHVACSGTNAYYTCIPGATYDPGMIFDNSATDKYASSPNISTIGKSNMILTFTYQCGGYTGTDYGILSFSSNGGSTWNDQPKQYYNTSSCTKQSISVPAAYNGISNFRIGFRWINGSSGNGINPPFAIDSISLGASSLVLGCSTEDSITISCITGIQQLLTNSSVNIYPNPSDGSITVGLQDIANKPTIEIYNVLGQSIYTASLIKPETNIDLKAQPKGVYFYNILDAKGNKVSSGNLILQ